MKLLFGLTFIFIHTIGFTQQVSDFTLVNAMNGKNVSLTDYSSYPGVIIIFTSNTCPYDGYYLNRIQKLAQEYDSKVPIVLVNSHVNESIEAMRQYGEKCKFSIPYLADKDQTLMQSLGATKSPEAFLLKKVGGKFTVWYRGAIDDNAQVESDVHVAHLKSAINALLEGKAVQQSEVRPVGCTIRKK